MGAFALSSEAGWNQTAHDWRHMIGAGAAYGQFVGDQLVASTVVLAYDERLAWIGMVLTTEQYRGRGLATGNLRRAIALCREHGWTAGLDATPAGEAVYEPLGFRGVFGLQRFVAQRVRRIAPRRRELAVRPLVTSVDLDAVATLDAQVFGAERRQLLGYLRKVQPERALIAEGRGRLLGFVFARPGRQALHIGPLCADGPNTAKALLTQALGGYDQPVSIDVPDDQTEFTDFLGELDFQPVRRFTRMVLDDGLEPGDTERCFAIAGPEFG